jgi:DAK2 domain fusion protein YloV
MKIEAIGVSGLKRSLKSAADYLSLNAKILDNLNVFPVPDGDTGVNMLSTLKPAVDALLADGVGSCADAWALLSEQANKHSRGNSGFILACFIRGFSKRFASGDQITAELIRGGFDSGSYAARSALLSPVEGTMVTIITAMAEAMAETESRDIAELLQSALNRGRKEIFETPRLLPVLARAGVVDAGGLGFIFVIEGMRRGLIGVQPKSEKERDYRFQPDLSVAKGDEGSLSYRFCTELTVEKKGQLPWPELKAFLEQRGNSIAIVQEEEYIKLHIHTNAPEQIRAKMAEQGTILASKVDDMAEQINTGVEVNQNNEAVSVLAVVPGSGFRSIFHDLEAGACLQYGDRLPSSGEILEVLEEMDTDNIIVLPNEKNIIPAAMLAQKNSRKQVFLLPTENVVQGITALYGFNEEDSPQQNIRSMGDCLDLAVCLKVYQSNRDTRYGSVEIKKGDFFVLHREDILAVDAFLVSAVERGLAELELGEAGCISFYYSDAFDQSCTAELEQRVQRLPNPLEVEFHYGGQTASVLIVALE